MRSDEDSPTKHYADLYAMIILIKSNVAILTIFLVERLADRFYR